MNKEMIWDIVEGLEKAMAETAEVVVQIEPGPDSPVTHAQYATILSGVKVMGGIRTKYLALYKEAEEKERKALESLQSGYTNESS